MDAVARVSTKGMCRSGAQLEQAQLRPPSAVPTSERSTARVPLVAPTESSEALMPASEPARERVLSAGAAPPAARSGADLARAVGSNGRVDAAGECIADRVSLPGPVRCTCSTLVPQVQRALRDLPAGDEAGLRSVSSEVTRRLATAAVTGRFRVKEYVKESRSILESAAPVVNSFEELQDA
ncbi:MAG: hypothetical protein SGPRY_014127 [Prymnesium sp.]